ncbi:Histidine utilization repressor [Pararobbsia alpina]|uniref:histidine utilization repressor n=1 Tax=Pararobbsia alpina TaxID=621374 RepID=UPI0039A63EF4
MLLNNKDKPVPLYDQVKRYITDRMERGEWSSGTRLPTEQELVNELGVSRMTVHRALRELSAQGILRRVQGVGTFISTPVPSTELLEIRDIAEDIHSRGHRHHAKVVKLEAVRASLDMATTFDLRPGTKIFRSLVVHYENDMPIQLEDRYVTPSFAPDYLEQDFSTQTTTHYLRAIHPATELEHLVFAVTPDVETQRLLEIDEREPCLLVVRRTWIDSAPATKTLLTCPGSRFSLGSRRKL